MFDNALYDAEGTFDQKLQLQLEALPDDVHRIAADISALYYVYPHEITVETKAARVGSAAGPELELTIDPVAWSDLLEAFKLGNGRVGQFYLTNKPAYFRFVIELALACKSEGITETDDDSLIRAANRIRHTVPRTTPARHAVLHLLVPDRFERTVSGEHRKAMLAAFGDLAPGIDDEDDALFAIRQVLAARSGDPEFDYYNTPGIREQWDKAKPDPNIEKIRKFVKQIIPDENTRLLVLDAFANSILIAHQINPRSWAIWSPSAEALRLGVSWTETLVIQKNSLRVVVEEQEFTARFSDFSSLEAAGITVDRSFKYGLRVDLPYSRLAEWLPRIQALNDSFVANAADGVKTRCHFHEHHDPVAINFLNSELGIDLPNPSYYPETQQTAQWWIEKTTVAGWPSRQEGEWAAGRAIFYWPEKIAAGHVQSKMREGDVVLHFTDQQAFTGISRVKSVWREEIPTPEGTGWDNETLVVTRLEDHRKLDPVLDRDDLFLSEPFASRLRQLPAQGHKNLFYKTGGGLGLWGAGFLTPVPRPLLDILRDAYRAQTSKELVPEGWPIPSGLIIPPDSCEVPDDLAMRTHMPPDELCELRDLLDDKKHLILEGPPGAGKTYLADLLARWVANEDLEGEVGGRVELVQFHQSYGYEDFVQGLRPVSRDGAVVFEVVDGIFLQMCKRAAEDPENAYVLIIDEINRGNLSRIFGELLMALEYRDKPVRLPYGDAPLRIPENLYLIGTMNSTDRSLALIDYALRRRFYFHRLMPVVDGAAPIYRNWLAARPLADRDKDRLHRLFVSLNQKIGGMLSPDYQVGHSYFMRDGIHTDSGLARVWKHAVTPLLQEYFHTSRDRDTVLQEFTIPRLLGNVSAGPSNNEVQEIE
jgi:hypothetical protein